MEVILGHVVRVVEEGFFSFPLYILMLLKIFVTTVLLFIIKVEIFLLCSKARTVNNYIS